MKIPDNLRWEATGKTLGKGGQATVFEVFDKTSGDDKKYALKSLVKGKPKSAYLRFAREIQVIKICEQIVPPVVHRDISPSNILILPDETIKVIDFGLCQIENEDKITLIDEGVGTQNYMSPECESGAEG